MTHPDAHVAAHEPVYSPQSDRDLARSAELPSPETHGWNLAQRLGVRFLVVYFILYPFPGPLEELPLLGAVQEPYTAFWRIAVPWVGAHVLRLSHPVSIQPSGSGDKLFDWVQVFAMLVLAALGAALWTAIDRRDRAQP